MATSAKIITDSIGPLGTEQRLTTFALEFPRIVLAEFNTHRMFSRSASSSRAIPVATFVQRVMTDPFIPSYWGKNQKGMQADQELSELERVAARGTWLEARDYAVSSAKRLSQIGVHKQITNRLLEPFMWCSVVVTSSEWDNFFCLRTHKSAQPEIRDLAVKMYQAYVASTPQRLACGEFHLPFVSKEEVALLGVQDAIKCSTARCARASYNKHDGTPPELADDTRLFNMLLADCHMSPFEHQATPMSSWGRSGNFKNWVQHRKTIAGENQEHFTPKEPL